MKLGSRIIRDFHFVETWVQVWMDLIGRRMRTRVGISGGRVSHMDSSSSVNTDLETFGKLSDIIH